MPISPEVQSIIKFYRAVKPETFKTPAPKPTSAVSDEVQNVINYFRGTKPKEEDGFEWGIMAWLDRVLRLNYASASYAKETVKDVKKYGRVDLSWEGHKRKFNAYWEGLAGRSKVFFSEVLEEAGWDPETKLGRFARGTVGLGLDIFLDPATYVTFGGLTKFGKLSKAAKAVRLSGKPVKLSSKLARQAAKYFGFKKPSAEVIKKLRAMPILAATAAEQAKLGQRALIKYGGRKVIAGARVYQGFAKTQKIIAATPLGKAGRQLSKMFQTPKGAVGRLLRKGFVRRRYIKGEELDWCTKVARRIKRVAKTTGRTVDDIADEVSRYVERPKSMMFKDVHPEVRLLAGKLGDRQTQRLAIEQAVQVPVTKLGVGKEFEIDALERGMGKLGAKRVKRLTKTAQNRARMVNKEIEIYEKQLAKAQKAGLKTGQLERQIVTRKGQLVKIEKTLRENIKTETKALATRKAKIEILEKSMLKDPEYLTHVITEEGLEWLNKQKAFRGLGRRWSDKHASTLQRALLKEDKVYMTIAEANAYVKTKGFKGKEFFHTNPVYLEMIRGIRHAKAVSGAEFLDEAGRMFGKAAGAAGTEGWIPSTQKRLKNFVFDPEIAAHIDRHFATLGQPEELRAFTRLYDRIQNWWKAWTLGIFPAYHFRNMIGNVWNSFVLGNKNPANYYDSLRVQVALARATKATKATQRELVKGGIRNMAGQFISYEEIARLVKETGVKGRGWYGAEIISSVKDIFEHGTILPSRRNIILKKGMQFGTHVEDNARISHFIDRLKKMWSVEDAAWDVRKALFDYMEVTDFERRFMKRPFPFYTWYRKNLPLQVEQLLHQPGKYIAIEKLRGEMAGGPEPERKFLPQWLKERYAFRVGKPKLEAERGKPGAVLVMTARYFPLENWLPAADLFRMFRPAEVATELLTPLAKLPLELMTSPEGRSWYFNRVIREYEGQKKQMLGIDIPAKLDYALRSIRLLSELDRLFGKKAQNLTPTEKIIRSLTGIKLYRQQLGRMKMGFRRSVMHDINLLKKGLKKAILDKRPKEADRIRLRIRKIFRMMR